MRRLKSFTLYNKLYESNTELISVIKDMSLELTDLGFNFNLVGHHSDRLSFIINHDKKPFYTTDFLPFISDMIDFMKGEGWNHRIEFEFYDGYEMGFGDTDGYVKDGELFYHNTKHNNEDVVDRNCPLSLVVIIFTRSVVKESIDDTSDILTNVKDMLLEISDMDYITNCVIRRMDGKEFIRIGIVKPTTDWVKTYKHSFTYGDIKEYLDPIVSYLESEGYIWNYNKGTHGQPPKYGNKGPYVVSSGSVLDSGFKSKIEMWFEKGFDEVQSRKAKYGF